MNALLSSAERIKKGYERFPYPGVDGAALISRGGSMPPLPWMLGIGRPGQVPPSRILVAGCGTGVEAFILSQHWPAAEIVAIDFSPRSIAVARRLARTLGAAERKGLGVGQPVRRTAARRLGAVRRITFSVADLTDSALVEKIGGDFDLITCHGVLSCLPDPGRALRVLAKALKAGGALYLGVNGAGHPATALRPWLSRFGVDVLEMKDERRLRELLGLWDALYDDDLGEHATMPASYLASDVCGAHFNNWTLGAWRAEARRAGWEVVGTAVLPPALRLIMEGGREGALYPAGIGELAERLDQVRPAGFHRMMLRRVASVKTGIPEVQMRGARGEGLRWTGLYRVTFLAVARGGAVTVRLVAASLGVRFEGVLTSAEAAALPSWLKIGLVSGAGMKIWVRNEAARRRMWLWKGLGVVAVATADLPAEGESAAAGKRRPRGPGAKRESPRAKNAVASWTSPVD